MSVSYDLVEVFSASWCSGCSVVKRALTTAGIPFVERDIDIPDIMEQAAQIGIRGIPVTRILKGGEVVESIVGATPQAVSRIIEICGTE